MSNYKVMITCETGTRVLVGNAWEKQYRTITALTTSSEQEARELVAYQKHNKTNKVVWYEEVTVIPYQSRPARATSTRRRFLATTSMCIYCLMVAMSVALMIALSVSK